MAQALPPDELRATVGALADALEAELRAINRWSDRPPPPEAFHDMGAFGGRTLGFEQWIQFVLIPRIRTIVSERGELPSQSAVGAYAVRELDGDPDADRLCSLLSRLDWLIEYRTESPDGPPAREPDAPETAPDTIALGDTGLPSVIYTLVDVLPQFEGEGLEAQLQTYDVFLGVLSPVVRPELSALLRKAAAATGDPVSRARIERAARSIADGGQAVG